MHVVVVVRSAAGADEEGSTEQRCRCRTDLLDFRYARRHGSCVNEDMLVEAVLHRVSEVDTSSEKAIAYKGRSLAMLT